jgi:cellulose synthase/poly-beta-1,6-N-acetylglucosamine synthase-like glycosyltransferase
VIIVPCKGLEEDFDENIRALFTQDYRDYEIIFVTESESDPAYAVLSKLIRQFRRSAWMVVAGESRGCGQKVHNLCAAIEMLNSIDRRAEVLVFADSDARTHRQWLSELIAPLGDKRVGATTGFRWYLPAQRGGSWGGGLTSILLSVWNASAVSLLGERSSFAWGGSTAIRRENFEKLGIKARWQGAVSDDYALTSAIHEAGQRIKFIPPCLIPSYADISLKDLLEFTTRQIRITRVYSPRVWILALFTHCLYNFTFFGGLLWLLVGSFRGEFNQSLALLLIGVFAIGAISGWVRAGAAANLLKAERERLQRYWWAYALLGPVVSLIYLYNLGASARTTRIIWRGISYELISPSETVIRHRPAQRGAPDSASRSARQRKASVRTSTQK